MPGSEEGSINIAVGTVAVVLTIFFCSFVLNSLPHKVPRKLRIPALRLLGLQTANLDSDSGF